MTTRFKATAPAKDKDGNLCFNGKTCGIRFERGVAHFDALTIDKEVGLTAEQIADSMIKDFGYSVVDAETGQPIEAKKQKTKGKTAPVLEPAGS